MLKPKKPKKKPAEKHKCPGCGMLVDGNRAHKGVNAQMCYWVIGRRGWRELGVYDG